MARDCRKKTEDMQNKQTSGWSGTDDKTKGKPGEGKGKQDKGQGQRQEQEQRKGQITRQEWEERISHEDKQETHTGQEDTEWTDTSWYHADNWTDADWWSSDWSTDLWNDPAWEQAARQFAIDAAGSRTVQSNAWRKNFDVWWCDDVRVVSQLWGTAVNKTTLTETCAMIGTTNLSIGFRTR